MAGFLTSSAAELDAFIQSSHYYVLPWLIVMAALWVFNIIDWVVFRSRLRIFGIYPRHLAGLPGILFSPFIHQNFNHLFFNSIPLFALGLIILTRGAEQFIFISVFIILVEGLAVWLIGRRAIHIGASGLVSGYFGYLIATAYLSPSFTSIIVGMLVVYYFGAIFWGIFPQEDKISWESHLYGFLAGILSAFIPVTKIVSMVIPSRLM